MVAAACISAAMGIATVVAIGGSGDATVTSAEDAGTPVGSATKPEPATMPSDAASSVRLIDTAPSTTVPTPVPAPPVRRAEHHSRFAQADASPYDGLELDRRD
jgi:hypothetical protein